MNPDVQVTVHVALMWVPLLATVLLIALFRRGGERHAVTFLDVVPFAVLGVGCLLIMSADGVPIFEWGLPLLCMPLIRLCCRDDPRLERVNGAYFLWSVAACWNFLLLLDNGFTARPKSVELTSLVQTRLRLEMGKKALLDRFPADHVVQAGPLQDVLGNDAKFEVVARKAEPEWHTGLTGLHRVRRKNAIVWCPGGRVAEVSGRLEIR